MRAALTGLTLRGRSLLAAGLACAACAVVLGERDLLRVGVLLVALPVAAAVTVARTRYRLSCTRRLDPVRVPVGQEASVLLRLRNVSRLPTGLLLVEDTVPYALGGRPRFVVDRLEPSGSCEVGYPVRSDLRGRYQIGPLSVRLSDPFGLCELSRSFSTYDSLVVTPVVHALPPVRLGGDWTGGGESRARSVSTRGEDDVATREYRHGDDLRRVHWRATARHGDLMVRREEQPWQSRGTLLLDCRQRAHRGHGPGSSFEWAVSAVASIGAQLSTAGYTVRLVTDSGDALGPDVAAATGAFDVMLLDALAVVSPTATESLDYATTSLRHGPGGLVVAVLGALSPRDAESFARLHDGVLTGVALLLDTATWGELTPHQREVAADAYATGAWLLRNVGWRVVPVRHGDELAAVWRHASVSASAEARA